MADKKYDFGERTMENNIEVIQTPKYKYSKENVIKLIEKFNGLLSENDFWILKNFNKNKTNLFYSGLIITHEALIKINDTLSENEKFNQSYCSDPTPYEYLNKKGMFMEYRDKRDGMYEVGEISENNCKNEYPFAMLLKRTFDRVVKRKAKLSYLYSESEADEFKNDNDVVVGTKPKIVNSQAKTIADNYQIIQDEMEKRGLTTKESIADLDVEQANELCKLIDERIKKNG